MIVNHLKPLLGEGWKEKFVHRDLWDPDGYGVASFDLGGERETALVINFATEDLMQYYFDDLPEDEWIKIDNRVFRILNLEPKICYINRKYQVKRQNGNIKPLSRKINRRQIYPTTSICSGRSIVIHRLISAMFVPNPEPERYMIVNHIDLSRDNFSKENLEWCDLEWNAKRENKKVIESKVVYIRLVDGKRFTREELKNEYKDCSNPSGSIQTRISAGKTWKGSMWTTANTLLEDYLSRHPLQDDWYQHPTLVNVRANGCGVLEVDGKLRIGALCHDNYVISISTPSGLLKTASHRIILECFLGRELSKGEQVDHIIPITKEDINNSKENLQPCTQKENRNNPLAAQKFWKETKIFDLFGNLIDTLKSLTDLRDKYGINICNVEKNLVISGKYIVGDVNKTNYIYYKWEIKDGVRTCIAASLSLCRLYRTSAPACINYLRNNFLNTGIPAPDGYYYQQGDPWNMIYDPDNKERIKKRPERKWRDAADRKYKYDRKQRQK